MSWRKRSLGLDSMGSQSKKAASMGDLHRRRAESQGQFFTPEWVSAGIWEALSGVVGAREHLHVLDSSVGSASLLGGAPVEKCNLYGLDPDGRCIEAISADARDAGIEYDFRISGMESLDIRGMDIAIFNPPFSIQLQHPALFPYECTHYGKFGPNTSALSHEYALEQALDSSSVVVAVLPYSMLDYCKSKTSVPGTYDSQPSLRMVVQLPNDCFMSEEANVKTAAFFFALGDQPVVECQVKDRECRWPSLEVPRKYLTRRDSVVFKINGIEIGEKIITLPVTGDRRVDMHHHGRRVVLGYHCAETQARVENGILVKPVVGKRIPKSIKYSGDGKLLIDVMLLQDDPEAQLDRLCNEISSYGGEPVVSETLAGYYKKLIKRHQRAIAPMHRTIQGGCTEEVVLTAKRRMMLDPSDFNSPGVAKGEVVKCQIVGGIYNLEKDGEKASLRSDEVVTRYDISGSEGQSDEWRVLHKGLWKLFPALAEMNRRRMENSGIDQWLAEFQSDSVNEGLISPYGYIGAHEQGAGKSRSGLALCLLHSGCNMFVVESGLVSELLREIKRLGIPDHLWKRVARNNDMPDAKINIVSYGDLRHGIKVPAIGKRKARTVKTNADRWRRKINFMVCDEGGLLANGNTQQSIAVQRLSVRKLAIYDGTPMRNQVRNLLPLCVASAGNGVAHQPFGVRGKAYLEKRMITSCDHTVRGEDEFYDAFVETVWVSNEFRQDLVTGSRREIPRIRDLRRFWDWLAPNIQRRVRKEPALEIFNNCPEPNITVHSIDWNSDHFDHYMRVAEEFATWYRKQNANSGKSLNLITVLARVGAVLRAANSPHISSTLSMDTYMSVTSKQEYLIKRIKYWKDKGRKVVVYAASPDVQTRIGGLLKSRYEIDSVLYTGQQSTASRTKKLDDEFRFGDTDVLLATMVANRGLNLEQASIVLYLDRGWSSSAEQQCLYRVLRPSQTKTVEAEMFHLVGGIDEYCAQLIEWKAKAASAGLDFGLQCSDDEEFVHMDTILRRFCDSVLDENTTTVPVVEREAA